MVKRASALAAALLLFVHGGMRPAHAHPAIDPSITARVRSNPAQNQPTRERWIAFGRALFERETFSGNGRTCSTCHTATENFALSPEDVARRDPNDPLFVAETNPALAQGFEVPALMRQFALICENLDGFDRPCVMRGVPHTTGLSQSIAPDTGDVDREAFPLANPLGWSGDGSPGTGSLREFAIGAVIQHFPRTLNRVPGRDFRLPTAQELKALELFQLSLGRQAREVSLDGDDGTGPARRFRDPNVERGRQLFNEAPSADGGTRSCAGCHNDGGANDADGNNRLFDTGTRLRANAPGCLFPDGIAGDGGFGTGNVQAATLPGCGLTVTFRGDGRFNTPSLIESADTTPLFSNNSASTVEDAVAHYTSTAFSQSPAGNNNPFVLSERQINQVGGLLRALNVLDNIRESTDRAREALRGGSRAGDAIAEAVANTQDAIEVLTDGPLPIYQGTVPTLRLALASLRQAGTVTGTARRSLLQLGIRRLQQARQTI